MDGLDPALCARLEVVPSAASYAGLWEQKIFKDAFNLARRDSPSIIDEYVQGLSERGADETRSSRKCKAGSLGGMPAFVCALFTV